MARSTLRAILKSIAALLSKFTSAFSSDIERLRRFELEVQASRQLNHPNHSRCSDVQIHDRSPYVVYCDNTTTKIGFSEGVD